MSLIKLNSNLSCKLCCGYLINATTIVDCFHSFCKSCLIKHLEKTNKCPVCKLELNKDKLVSNHLKHDLTLQSLVYKIVPNLFSNENDRRINFYKDHPHDKINNDLEKFRQETIFWDPNELIDISIEYLPKSTNQINSEQEEFSIRSRRRYLRVECGMKVSHLKKWIRHKMELPSNHQVIVTFNDEILNNNFKMIDLAYIFSRTIPNVDKIKNKNSIETNILKTVSTHSKLKNGTKKIKLSIKYPTNNATKGLSMKKKSKIKKAVKNKNLLNHLNGNSNGESSKDQINGKQIQNSSNYNGNSSEQIEKLNSKMRIKSKGVVVLSKGNKRAKTIQNIITTFQTS